MVITSAPQRVTVDGAYATNDLLGEPLHLLYGLSSRLVNDVPRRPIFAIQLRTLPEPLSHGV